MVTSSEPQRTETRAASMATLPPPTTTVRPFTSCSGSASATRRNSTAVETPLCVLALDARLAAALAADGQVERGEALLAQLVERDVAPDLDAAADLDAHLAQHVDLGCDDVLLQLVGGDAVGHHAAGLLVPLEHDGVVAHVGEIERA